MSSERILVTGGSGFIGRCFIESLIEKDYKPLSYDLKPIDLCPFILGDINDSIKFKKTLKIAKISHVFHLAAIADLNEAHRYPAEAIKINVGGTYVVAKMCSELHTPLSFISTCCVYGNTPDHPSNEESILVPTEIYAASKIVGENLIKQFHEKDGLPYNILRYGTTYGPTMREALAVHIFITQALNNKPLTIHGSGKQTRTFVYIDDLIEASIRILENEVIGETLNITGEEEISVLDLAHMILEETDKPESMIMHVDDRPGQIQRESIDILKAKKMLDWKPTVDMRMGIKRSIEALSNPN